MFLRLNSPIFFGTEDTILPSVPEMEFLDIKSRKDLRLLLHAIADIHNPFYWHGGFYSKPYYSQVLKSLQKIRKTRKLESIHE